MKLRMAAWIAVLVLAANGTAFAAAGSGDEDVTKDPGYVDFGTVNLFGNKEADVEVLIEKELLNMLVVFSKSKDPELADMLGKLKQIRVQSFSMEASKLDAVEKKTEEISAKLEGQGWARIVKVRDRRESEHTYIYMKSKDNKIQGLVVMNIDPKDKEQASFVNIVGEIDPEQLGKLQHKFDIDGLDSLPASFTHPPKDKSEKK
jgi:hypothetical protein